MYYPCFCIYSSSLFSNNKRKINKYIKRYFPKIYLKNENIELKTKRSQTLNLEKQILNASFDCIELCNVKTYLQPSK